MKALLSFVLLPFFAACLCACPGKRIKYATDFLCQACALALLGLSVHLFGLIQAQRVLEFNIGGWLAPAGLSVTVDGFSGFMLIVVSLVSFLVLIFSTSYMNRYSDKWKFHSLFMLMLTGMYGVIISSDLFNLYCFLELASISAYVLVAFGVEAQDLEASFRYAIMGALASVLILLGLALLYGYASTLNIRELPQVLAQRPRGSLISFISVLFLAGFGLKAAIVPFHSWLADAHSSAPAPVSATLSGLFIKTVGVYCLMRVFFNCLGLSREAAFILMLLGIISMVAGAFLAVGQNDIKRMFAYSSVSQVGFIIFAFGIGTPLAILAGLFHIFNHAAFKSLLFLNTGAVETSTGTRDINRLGGLNSRMPVTGFCGLMGCMSLAGIPPLAGFWSKFFIIIAALQAGYFAFGLVAVLASVVTLVYCLKFQSIVFFGRPLTGQIKEAAFSMKVSMVALSLVCLFGGFLFYPAFRPSLESAARVLSAKSAISGPVFSIAAQSKGAN